MTKINELVPEYIRALDHYTPGKPLRQAERESGVRCIKMASNENPFGPSPRALEAIRSAAVEANFYPDNDCAELRRQLAERNKLESEQVLVTAGSTSFLDIIARSLLAPGLNAVSSQRSFIVYPIVTRAAGGKLVEVPMKNDTFDLDAILAAIDSKTRVVFLANPNNPTGTIFDEEALRRFLQRIPEHLLVVLDEAYCDFAEHFASARGVTWSRSLDHVREGRNLVVLRTFSKAHGLAGLRVGYGFGPATLLHDFGRVRTTFSVSGIAQAAALAALDDDAHIRKTLENNATELAWLAKELSALGLRVVPSAANFIYLETGEDAAILAKRLQAEGIIVRPLTAWGAPKALRVTVGTPEQNQKFMGALKKVMQGVAVR